MPIAVLVLALVAYGYVMVAFPEYRTIGLAVGGAAAAGLGLYFWLTDPEAALTAERIDPGALVLDRLAVEPSLRGATITGRVHNTSQWRLREMTITLRLHDCPDAEVALDACPVVAEATALARPDAPPGQLRDFSAHATLRAVPEPEGVLRWEWAVTGTRATR